MDRKAILWWYALENLILGNNKIILSTGKTYLCDTIEKKERSFLEIRDEILHLDQKDLSNELHRLFSNYIIDWHSLCEELCLNWSEVKELANEPLVTLGAHTQDHHNLVELATSDDVKEDIIAGYRRIKEEIGVELSVFAYPFGLAKEREIEILSELGNTFLLAVIIGNEAVTEKSMNPYCLPRIMMDYIFNCLSIKRIQNCCVI